MTDNGIGLYGQDEWRPRPDLTLNLGLRYDWSSLFGDDKNNLAPRLGFAWDLGTERETILKANFGIFFDRNLLSAAATVPELGGIFTRSAFDVALPRLGVDYTRFAHRPRDHLGLSRPAEGPGPRRRTLRTGSSRRTCARIRSRSTSFSDIPVDRPARSSGGHRRQHPGAERTLRRRRR